MRLTFTFAVGFWVGIFTQACVSPTSPSGPYTCFTQPRAYITIVNGQPITAFEIDRYEQPTPCPDTRIQ